MRHGNSSLRGPPFLSTAPPSSILSRAASSIFLKCNSHLITLQAWPRLRPARCSEHRAEGTHSLQVVPVQGTDLTLVPVLPLTWLLQPKEWNAHSLPGPTGHSSDPLLPTSPPSSQLLPSPTGLLSVDKSSTFLPQGLCTCSSLNLEVSFPRFIFYTGLTLLCQALAQMSPPRKGLP